LSDLSAFVLQSPQLDTRTHPFLNPCSVLQDVLVVC